MPTLIHGLSERKGNLYIIGDRTLLEIEDPSQAKIMLGGRERELSPETALYLFLGRQAEITHDERRLGITSGTLKALLKAYKIIEEPARIAYSPSLQLASLVTERLVPGVPYYDAVARTPGIAVPRWAEPALRKACEAIPLLEC